MRLPSLFGPTDGRRTRWKNGLGTTRELCLWPPTARFESGDFDWRISAAPVQTPGPFSRFPGFERILLITAGNSLQLEHRDSGRSARLRPFEPYRFAGEEDTTGTPIGGPVEDLGVLLRRGVAQADVLALRLRERRYRVELEPRDQAVFVAFGGPLRVRIAGAEEPGEIEPQGGLLVLAPEEPREYEFEGLAPEAVLVSVRLFEP